MSPTIASRPTRQPITGMRKRSSINQPSRSRLSSTWMERARAAGSPSTSKCSPSYALIISPYPSHLLPEEFSQASKSGKRIVVPIFLLALPGWQSQRDGKFLIGFSDVFIASLARQPTTKSTRDRPSLFDGSLRDQRATKIVQFGYLQQVCLVVAAQG